jgi:chromosome segregation ATPase
MNKTNIIIILAIILTCLFSGCNRNRRTPAISDKQNDTVLSQPQPNKYAPQSSNAVESAIEISAKYARLTEDMTTLKEKYQTLEEENKQLRNELVPCKTQLAQAQKELAEANDLLVEMRVELNNWKSNILGFRNEMRQANTAQLEALAKILAVLGAETDSNVTKTAADSN